MSGKSARVGMHIRLATGLQDVLERAQKLQMPWFQSFLINQKKKEYWGGKSFYYSLYTASNFMPSCFR
jgi:hypothetical protein